MTEKHLSDLDQVARDIYNFAANKITAFLQAEYGEQPEGTMDSQMEDFHLIAERASVYLMGNVVALMDPSVEEECILVQNKHLRSMIDTIRKMSPNPGGLLN